jgi:protein SCO1
MSRPHTSRLLWAGLCAVLAFAVALGARALLIGSRRPLPASALQQLADYGPVPDFTLTERSGRTVGLKDLEGTYWVADFIFTRCTGVCPILTSRMATLARSLRDVQLVSFTVDPAWDTPGVLRRYAADQSAPAHWLFLTGPREELHRIIGEGFRLSIADLSPASQDDGDLITHSDRFVLVDPAGRIRGYYHGAEEESVARLVADLARLRSGAGS